PFVRKHTRTVQNLGRDVPLHQRPLADMVGVKPRLSSASPKCCVRPTITLSACCHCTIWGWMPQAIRAQSAAVMPGGLGGGYRAACYFWARGHKIFVINGAWS